MSRNYPGPSIGDVHATTTGCQLLNAEGEPCGKPGQPGIPLGICQFHAIAVTRSVLKLGGIVVEERS